MNKIASLLGIMAMNNLDRAFASAINFTHQQYYHRYSGKSKTFKKNKRKGL